MKNQVILFIEDNEVQQKVIRILASHYGFDAEVHSDCTSGVNAFKADPEHYAMIFMDGTVPDVDGPKCTEFVRVVDHSLKKHTPIVAMTGQIDPNYKKRCFEAGMDDYMTKPFTAEELHAMVQKWAPQTQAVS